MSRPTRLAVASVGLPQEGQNRAPAARDVAQCEQFTAPREEGPSPGPKLSPSSCQVLPGVSNAPVTARVVAFTITRPDSASVSGFWAVRRATRASPSVAPGLQSWRRMRQLLVLCLVVVVGCRNTSSTSGETSPDASPDAPTGPCYDGIK